MQQVFVALLLDSAGLCVWQDVAPALTKLVIWREGLVLVSSNRMSQEVPWVGKE